MNAPIRNPKVDDQDLDSARDESYALLGSVEHYCNIARLHLMHADDPCALMAISDARMYFLRALEEFKPIRQAIQARNSVDNSPSELEAT